MLCLRLSSLTKIYSDLSRGRDVDKSGEVADRECPSPKDDMSPPNRFAILEPKQSKRHQKNARISSEQRIPDCQCDTSAKGQDTARKTPTPRLVDDWLGDAFEIRKEVEVCFRLSQKMKC